MNDCPHPKDKVRRAAPGSLAFICDACGGYGSPDYFGVELSEGAREHFARLAEDHARAKRVRALLEASGEDWVRALFTKRYGPPCEGCKGFVKDAWPGICGTCNRRILDDNFYRQETVGEDGAARERGEVTLRVTDFVFVGSADLKK